MIAEGFLYKNLGFYNKRKNGMNEKKVTGFDYLWCALYACAAFAIELLLVFVEGKMGLDNNNLTVS